MFMIGIDPHKGSHTATAVDAREVVVGELRVEADRHQRARLLEWAQAFEPRTWAIEGATGMGALLAQQLVGVGEHVVDVPPKAVEPGAVDGHRPYRQVRIPTTPAPPRGCVGGMRRLTWCRPRASDRVVLRLLAHRYHQLTAERTRTVCRLHALLGTKLPGGVMGVAEEKLVMEFLGHDEGPGDGCRCHGGDDDRRRHPSGQRAERGSHG